jgi:hypothetical protein
VARRLLPVAALGAVLVVATLGATALTASAGSQSRTVFVDGDSLALGTALFLSKDLPGWTVRQSVAVSRHAYDGVTPIKARGPALERVVIVDLGTNDDPSRVSVFSRSVRRVVEAAGSSRCVIWPTVNRPPYHGISWEGFNRTLRSLARTYDNLHVFEWAAMARAHPQWFGADRVHPTFAGYRARAAGLARLVKAC